uniref:Integrase catalytic domain-containing protein n=1 Tax=Cajanus cajan TaxID=3821 RepID=A0A151T8R6_CAJCA|nr:hypothetical protein KK1_018006 [Cajanus cajan]
MDVIGPIEPKALNRHRFFLVAIDYFTKWVKTVSYAHLTKKVVVNFVKKNIIYGYKILDRMITDNGSNLTIKMIIELYESFKIQHHNSSPYKPNINKKYQENYLHEMLPFALHGYQTSICTLMGAMPFSLVYGMEVVLPIEVEIPSLRVLMEAKLSMSEWVQSRLDQLNLIEEKRLDDICRGQTYQKMIKKTFDKKIGDLVLKKLLPAQKDKIGKWAPNYEGPYVVKWAFPSGALILIDMDGEELSHLVNSNGVRKYYA